MRGIPSSDGRSTRASAFALVALVAVSTSACVDVPKLRPGPLQIETKVYDESGNLVSPKGGSASRILGLGPRVIRPADQDTTQDEDLTPQEKQRRREAQLRLQFGKTILIRGEVVTKRYFMAQEIHEIFHKISGLQKAAKNSKVNVTGILGGKGDRKSVLGSMLGDHEVAVQIIEDFETVPAPLVTNPAFKGGPMVPVRGSPKEAATNDLLLVTAKAVDLAVFEDSLNLFYANIPQVEIEVKVIEFSTSDSLSFGVTQVGRTASNPGTPTFANLSGSKLVSSISSVFPMSPPLGSGLADSGAITLGGIHDSWELTAELQMLQAQGRADIKSSPKLVVRNGGTAAISTFTEYPFPRAKFSGVAVASTDVSFRPVGITLGIRPIIAGTDTVILQVYADYSAVTGFAKTEPIETPIVSKRTAVTSVHVPDGKGTVIGGLELVTAFENETKIPLLGDIPLLGYLFRATSVQNSKTNLSFVITPRILIGGETVRGR